MTWPARALELLGTWSRPPDLPAQIAAALAALALLAVVTGRGEALLLGPRDPDPARAREDRRHFLALAAFAAALVSVAYIATYLRGGPRIVDATTYFLQGRALSQGDFSFSPLEPSASFRGRFLLFREGPEGATLGGIFPPGYPLLVAFGFLLGAPMVVGPLLAGALVVATYALARVVASEVAPERAEPIARGAALLSFVCAALRYHTADTMSHAASALGVTIALTAALQARAAHDAGARKRRWALLAGLATGYVVATRPVSAIPIALVTGALLARRRPAALHWLVGIAPGILLLLLSQRAVTGSWLASTQRMYYALSDGPPGCFRWGFGAGTGCVFEHGDFVAARLPGGYGLLEAAGVTLRRLHKHLLDVANLELLAPLVLVPALARARSRAVAAASALVVLQVLAYVPFYFDGDYPGGGARFFADVLPVEHALLVVGLAVLWRSGARFERGVFALLSAALAGFAVHGAHEHGKLRDRDGGVPMFEPDVLAQASVSKGLVFVETDHGFSLGHDPRARPSRGVVVARRRSDARDRLLYDALGRPPTYLYSLEPSGAGSRVTARVAPWMPPELSGSARFEAEAEWPGLGQEGGFAAPEWTHACASGSQTLVLTPSDATAPARATIALPVPSEGRWRVAVHVTRARSAGALTSITGAVAIAGERWEFDAPSEMCDVLAPREIDLSPPRALVTIEALGGPIGIDAFDLTRVDEVDAEERAPTTTDTARPRPTNRAAGGALFRSRRKSQDRLTIEEKTLQ